MCVTDKACAWGRELSIERSPSEIQKEQRVDQPALQGLLTIAPRKRLTKVSKEVPTEASTGLFSLVLFLDQWEDRGVHLAIAHIMSTNGDHGCQFQVLSPRSEIWLVQGQVRNPHLKQGRRQKVHSNGCVLVWFANLLFVNHPNFRLIVGRGADSFLGSGCAGRHEHSCGWAGRQGDDAVFTWVLCWAGTRLARWHKRRYARWWRNLLQDVGMSVQAVGWDSFLLRSRKKGQATMSLRKGVAGCVPWKKTSQRLSDVGCLGEAREFSSPQAPVWLSTSPPESELHNMLISVSDSSFWTSEARTGAIRKSQTRPITRMDHWNLPFWPQISRYAQISLSTLR